MTHPSPTGEPESMSVPMAAQEFGVRPAVVDKLVRDGDLDAFQCRNGTMRIPVTEVEQLKTRMRREP